LLGKHKHGPVVQLDRRLYSDCYRCGRDLIRARRGWRVARPDELPHDWKAQRQPRRPLAPPLFIAAASVALAVAAVYLGFH
jgi:hypothetical protein